MTILCASVCGQTHTHVIDPQIKSLQVARDVLVLENGMVDGSNEENQLHIRFDEMSHEVRMYSYSIEHLAVSRQPSEFSFQPSELVSGEYLKGFTTGDIVNYEHSMNTSREYTHYWFDFPHEEMVLTKSGNYRLTIYEDGDIANKVAEIDFVVVEPLVEIDAIVRANTDIEFNGRYQQVDIDVKQSASSYQSSVVSFQQPNEYTIVVTQNNRMDNAVVLKRPTYIEPNRLRYINNKALIFEGGNEYHHFDAFSCFYAGTGIDRVYHELGDYHALLLPNEIRKGQYIHEFDSNGRYVINAERTDYDDTEAEYMWVHWTLPAEQPWFDGALYIGGEIFGNELGLANRMEYDNEAKCYWLTALVKQGGYDYQYWFKRKPSEVSHQLTEVTTERVEGSYWQTENEYAIYVYWRPFGERYDRLVGVKMVQSTR